MLDLLSTRCDCSSSLKSVRSMGSQTPFDNTSMSCGMSVERFASDHASAFVLAPIKMKLP